MTSCTVALFLCVFLCSIDLSEEKINDYFENVASWGKHLENETVLIETNNIMEMILSGFNRFCEKTQHDENSFLRNMACSITYHHDAKQRISEEEQVVRVPFFHLACLYVKLMNIRVQDGKPPPVCGDFDVIFGLYQKVNEFTQNSTTCMSSTSTTVTPPTKMPDTTKTTTITLTSTEPINGGAATLFGHAHSQQTKRFLGFDTYSPQSYENPSHNILLLLSFLLNVVLLTVVVYTCCSSNQKQQTDACMLNGAPLTEYQLSTPLETEKECDRESKHLIQHHSHTVTMSPAD
ncbi:uncharacterized protein LOC114440447 [Parambassis ranga]|uniref:Uncharacterized protein LOC114440447 n=1 Tax=Parambassis ranga TaxID=210632 RepID=A0A6P7IXQ2_9TELE|nr:uncharacterized protein LOC114440447 [Parambassis ranga]